MNRHNGHPLAAIEYLETELEALHATARAVEEQRQRLSATATLLLDCTLRARRDDSLLALKRSFEVSGSHTVDIIIINIFRVPIKA